MAVPVFRLSLNFLQNVVVPEEVRQDRVIVLVGAVTKKASKSISPKDNDVFLLDYVRNI